MRAARFHGIGDIRVEYVDEPTLTSDQHVHVDVEWCGICGSDLHEVGHSQKCHSGTLSHKANLVHRTERLLSI